MPGRPITVAETSLFARQAAGLWSESERDAFVDHIARNPTIGDLVAETGGVRKIRWTRSGMGKRGGARVIYFYFRSDRPLYLLMAYAKAVREDLSPMQKRELRRLTALLAA